MAMVSITQRRTALRVVAAVALTVVLGLIIALVIRSRLEPNERDRLLAQLPVYGNAKLVDRNTGRVNGIDDGTVSATWVPETEWTFQSDNLKLADDELWVWLSPQLATLGWQPTKHTRAFTHGDPPDGTNSE